MARRIGRPMQSRMRQRGLRERGVDVAGESGRELVCQTRQHVLFMDHDGQPQPSGGEVGRSGHISAKAEHHVSLGAPQQPDGRLHRLKQARSDKQPGPFRARRGIGTGGISSSSSPAAGTTVVSSPRAVPSAVRASARAEPA